MEPEELFLPWNPVNHWRKDHDLVMIRQILLHGEKWSERFDPKIVAATAWGNSECNFDVVVAFGLPTAALPAKRRTKGTKFVPTMEHV